ncbi:TPR repeat-containing thioredoxin TTL4 [Rhynchospora pubera]|uniref:TPR repeat-containing thioredoxin TTL4 n=1 Tax=Rhynchospora pubera TaxID=906938 RepID=A0AAV8D572_9POAL|nr:TPR repeat-containing thioredoxin TTL4 [Rhynchospora pubera]
MGDQKAPSGCSMFGMFRRKRSASATTIPRFDPDDGSKASTRSDSLQNSQSMSTDVSSANNSSRRRPGFIVTSSATPPKVYVPPALPQTGTETSLVPAGYPVQQKPMSRKPPEPKSPLPSPGYTGLAAELDKMIHDRHKVQSSHGLVRATSGNMMIHGSLGNLGGHNPNRNTNVNNETNYQGGHYPNRQNNVNAPNQQGGASSNRSSAASSMSHAPTRNDPQQKGHMANGNGVARSVALPIENASSQEETAEKPEMCRALSRRFSPEELKEMGNEEYKQGRYAEALALYDRAIVMDPKKAAYWSNKAAALTGLGQLLEAVMECKEAVRIDPSYHRAHHRLANLYLRLGEPDKAINHYKLSLKEASNNDISKAQSVKSRIAKCNEARKLKDWVSVTKEAQSAIVDGADSAPQVFALQAEALLKLQNHDEAESVLIDAPKFDVNESTKFFGTIANAYVLMVQSQVDMAVGRFEDAVKNVTTASQIDPGNREIANLVRKTKAVASARSRGNNHFKASRFLEACLSYGEGLGHEPNNAVLLCNRAACQSKLGNYKKAIDDCNTALSIRPAYSKARLRRADCNAKMEKWEACIKDYQILMQEMPGNEEVSKGLAEAEEELKKKQVDDTKDSSLTALSPD